MEYDRDRAPRRRNGDRRNLLAGHLCEGNAFQRWRWPRQRCCGSVAGRAGLADQRNPRLSRIASRASGLAGHARLSALQLCDLRVRGTF